MVIGGIGGGEEGGRREGERRRRSDVHALILSTGHMGSGIPKNPVLQRGHQL
jgi:hypothetical protein